MTLRWLIQVVPLEPYDNARSMPARSPLTRFLRPPIKDLVADVELLLGGLGLSDPRPFKEGTREPAVVPQGECSTPGRAQHRNAIGESRVISVTKMKRKKMKRKLPRVR